MNEDPTEVTSEVESPEQVLQDKHENFVSDITKLAEAYGVNVLMAINYQAEDQTALEYVGAKNMLIENGLKYLFQK